MATYPAMLLPLAPVVVSKPHLPLPQASRCRVFCQIGTVEGDAIENLVIAFAPTFNLPVVQRMGTAGAQVEMQTDEHGEAEIYLARGMEVDVSIHGTRYTGRFTVPDQAEADLFLLLADAPSVYQMQRASVIPAPRSTP